MENDLSQPLSMMIDFRMSQIFASFVFGVIGLYLFRHAKKIVNYKLIFISIALMAYPMFTTNWELDWSVGILLCSLAYYLNESAKML